MPNFKLLPIIAIAATSACMESDDADTTQAALSFAELNILNADLLDAATSAGTTPVDNIPDTGSATYDGTLFLTLQDGSEDGVIGQAQMVSNFATDSITGNADNFYDLEGNATAGSLTLEDGGFDRVVGLVSGEMNGNVTFAEGAMDVETAVVGNFSGTDADYLSGVLVGEAAPTGADDIGVVGGFYLVD